MSWYRIWNEFVSTFFSIAPLVGLLLFIKIVLIGSPFANGWLMVVGIIFSLLGLFVFLQGVSLTLLPLSDEVGQGLANFKRPLILAIVFAVGLAATMVEPGLQTIASQAAEQSKGLIQGNTLIYVTALGFGFGALSAGIKIVYNLKFAYIMVPILLLCVIVGKFASPTFAGLAFDCAGAATGPVNIPVNCAIAIGLSRTVGADPLTSGFGIVGLTSMGSALAVLIFSALKGV